MKKLFPIFFVLAVACTSTPDPQEIIDKSIEVHGGKKFEEALASFKFRDKYYSVKKNDGRNLYTREFEEDGKRVKDVLYNSTEFSRMVNDTLVKVSQEWQEKYTESVNSVLYFFQLPYGLNDPAVKKEYLGETYIFKKPYHKIKVTFGQQGGGVDYEDEFIYWIHQTDFTMDFLAYSYSTDDSGIRFRQAINRRENNGILIQDYINFKEKSKDAPLEKHDEYFEKGQLKELSRIINEEVSVTF